MLKKFLIGTFALAVLLIGVTASAAVDLGPTTLRVGSSGQYVMNLQSAIGATPVDGLFGPMTKAKVMAFQASKGLVADGLVGPATKNAINAGSYSGGTVDLCPNGMTLASNCTLLPGVTPPAVTLCPNGMTLASNCTVAPGGTTPVLPGTEGSLAVTYAPTPISNLAVNRGETKNVAGLELKATGSDMRVNRVWLNLTAGTASPRIWLAASEMALLDGSTVLATVPLSASTVEEITVGTEYRVQFNGLNVNVPVNTTKVLTVRVTRPELTSTNGTINLAGNSVSVRGVDGAGLSEAVNITASRVLNLADATASVGTLTATLSSTSPKAQSVSGISATTGTLTPVKLLDFDLKAEDGAVNVYHISGVVTPTGCSSAECLASVELRDGSTVLASVVGADAIAFNDLNIDIAADSTKKLSIWGQVNPISGSLLAGEGVLVTIDDVDATSGPSFTNKSITPSVVGELQRFFRYAPTITFVSATGVNTGLNDKDGTFSIVFDVTAPSGSDIYVAKAVAIVDTNGTNEVSKIAAAGVGGVLAPSMSSTNTTASSGGVTLGAKVSAGQTGRFTISGYIPAGGGTAGFTGMKIDEINWGTTDDNTADFDQTWGLLDFKTPTVYVLGA
jgi:hypothetical protein